MRRLTRDEVRQAEMRFLLRVPQDIERVKGLMAYHQQELRGFRGNLKHLQETKKKFEARYGKQRSVKKR
jgi:hypothetical protein